MRRLTGNVAIVTGSTKTMGAAIVARLAAEGAKVLGCGRSADSGRRVAERVNASGATTTFVQADVEKEEDVEHTVWQAVQLFGRLDLVVNNAAALDLVRSDAEKPVVDEQADVFERILRVGLFGPFFFFKHAIPAMLQTGGGAFVSISSTSAAIGYRGLPAYSASKGGLEALSRQVAAEYGALNIRANVVRLGHIALPQEEAGIRHHTSLATARSRVMVPNVGGPEDVAAMVAFLCSAESRYLTGSVIPLDGGEASYARPGP
jgi:meso-butanediol dehydrogenase/(S,S)-butanediol dehydrogenase/diacetyl reductase